EKGSCNHGREGKQAVKESRPLVRQYPHSVGGVYAAVGCQNLVGEEIDGKRAEGKDGRVERKTEADHEPVRPVKPKNLPELQLVDGAGLSQFVAAFCKGPCQLGSPAGPFG